MNAQSIQQLANAINTNISTQGASQSTGNPFDIMINGNAFFVVNNGAENLFTRDGSFYVDGAGNLAMTSTGFNVIGWGVDEETMQIKQDTVTALRIMNAANMTYPPEATSKAYMSGIIDKNDTDVTSASGKVVNLNFFDQLGYSYTAKFVFKQSDNTNDYSLELDRILDSEGNEIDLTTKAGAALFGDDSTQVKAGKVSFDSINYEWDAAGQQLMRNGAMVADLSAIIEDGAFLAMDTVVDEETGKTVQDYVDAIATAYGYEGSTEEFLNLQVGAVDETAENPAAVEMSVRDMILNLAEEGPDDFRSLETFTGPEYANGATETSFATIGRYFEGVTVTFDAAQGYFKGINGLDTQTTAVLRLGTAGV